MRPLWSLPPSSLPWVAASARRAARCQARLQLADPELEARPSQLACSKALTFVDI
jgi:hypothetical protein